MKAFIIVIATVILAGSALALWACCKMAGKYSREEEKQDGK